MLWSASPSADLDDDMAEQLNEVERDIMTKIKSDYAMSNRKAALLLIAVDPLLR